MLVASFMFLWLSTGGAEVIECNGQRGIFVSEEKAQKLLEALQDKELCQEEMKLKDSKIKAQENGLRACHEMTELEREQGRLWQKRVSELEREVRELRSENRQNVYIQVALVASGVVLGVGLVFLSSEVLLNIK